MGLSISNDLQITETYVDPNNDFIAFSLAVIIIIIIFVYIYKLNY
jgi:hypothetical protein